MEVQKLIPPPTPDELKGLEESLLKEGCRDALVVWQGTILDGHNRYAICQKHGIAFDTVNMEFADRTEAMVWILKNQLSRRNLTEGQRGTIIMKHGTLVRAIEEAARKRQVSGKGEDGSGGRGKAKNLPPRVAEHKKKKSENESNIQLAKAAGIGKETIRRVKIIREHGTPEQVEAGEGAKRKSPTAHGQEETVGETSKALGELAGVSGRIVYRVKAVMERGTREQVAGPTYKVLTTPLSS